MKKMFLIVAGLALLLVGCGQTPSENEKVARAYLEGMGYEVVSFERESAVSFTEEKLHQLPGELIWAVQYVEPDEYVDKELASVSFMITNHPLDDQYGMGTTNATVLVYDGQAFGGWSFPHSKEPLDGGFYSIDGKTAEEVRGD